VLLSINATGQWKQEIKTKAEPTMALPFLGFLCFQVEIKSSSLGQIKVGLMVILPTTKLAK
jgi:hypothetical protein